jgi:hypothetical protein
MKDYGEQLQNILKLRTDQQLARIIELVVELIEENKHLRLENQQLKNEVSSLKNEVRQLKDEIAILKNQPPRPKIGPSKLETQPKGGDRKANWSKGSKNYKLVIDEVIKINLPSDEIPVGAKFKGYKQFIVQDLIITKKVTKYLLAEWRKPDGGYIFATLPKAVEGSHFGVGLRQYVVHQHNANRVPQNRIHSDLSDKGIEISIGQIDEILKNVADQLQWEKEQLLEAGLESECLQTDDTGARHKGKNSFTTVICNDYFSYFTSSWHKSRINFLEILCHGKIEYVITQESLDYIKSFKLAQTTIICMQNLLGSSFATREFWEAFLKKELFGTTARRVLTEGALIGALISRGKLTLESILMSDGAGQFNVFKHVLCWIHIERSIKKLVPINEKDRLERDSILDQFWSFYRNLKAYKKEPSSEKKKHLENMFDEIFSFNATEIPLFQALKKIRDCKHQLLLVLNHPNIPLHNNTSERDIREFVTKRKVSGGTRSDTGRNARDTFISLYKTCKKLGISFWQFLDDRLSYINKIPQLAILVQRKRAQTCPGP